jgi:hypothetical protein
MACIVLHLFACIYTVSSPSSLSVDPDTDIVPEADAGLEPDATVDDLALAAEQPGKPPLEHTDIAYSFSLMLALELLLLLLYLF